MCKCIGCEKIAKTKKGWCSVQCYRKHQRLVENKGRHKIGYIPSNETRQKLSTATKLRHRNNPAWSQARILELANPTHNSKKSHKGKDHPNWKGGDKTSTCLTCNTTIVRSRGEVTRGTHLFCSRECYEKINKSGKLRKHLCGRRVKYTTIVCDICSVVFEVPPCRKHTAKYCCMKCHNIGNHLAMPKANTSIEIKLKTILEDLNLDFKEQQRIGNITIPDFLVSPNIAVYADGEYWHTLPGAQEKDNNINKKLIVLGYKVVRFWGNEINNEVKKVQQKLRELTS